MVFGGRAVLWDVGNVTDHHFILWSRKCASDHYCSLNTCNNNDYRKIKGIAEFYGVSTMCSMLSTPHVLFYLAFIQPPCDV